MKIKRRNVWEKNKYVPTTTSGKIDNMIKNTDPFWAFFLLCSLADNQQYNNIMLSKLKQISK